MKKSTILIILIVTTLTFGQTEPKKIKMSSNAHAMRQELEKLIPIGGSLIETQQVLQANGFACSMRQQKSFIEMKEDKSVIRLMASRPRSSALAVRCV